MMSYFCVYMFLTFHIAVSNDQSTQPQETCDSKVNITQLSFAFLSFFSLISEGKRIFPFLCHFLDSHISGVFVRQKILVLSLDLQNSFGGCTCTWIDSGMSITSSFPISPLTCTIVFKQIINFSVSVPYWQSWESASPIEVAQWHYGMLFNDYDSMILWLKILLQFCTSCTIWTLT